MKESTRSKPPLTFEDIEAAFLGSPYFPIQGRPGVVWATQNGEVRAKVLLREGNIFVEPEGGGRAAAVHVRRVAQLFIRDKCLWWIFAGGVRQPMKALASSAEEAIDLWMGQTGSDLPRTDIRAEPEGAEASAANDAWATEAEAELHRLGERVASRIHVRPTKDQRIALTSEYGQIHVTPLRAAILLHTLRNAPRGAPKRVWEALREASSDEFPVFWITDLDGNLLEPWTPDIRLTHDVGPLDPGQDVYAIDYRRPLPRVPPVKGDRRPFNVKLLRMDPTEVDPTDRSEPGGSARADAALDAEVRAETAALVQATTSARRAAVDVLERMRTFGDEEDVEVAETEALAAEQDAEAAVAIEFALRHPHLTSATDRASLAGFAAKHGKPRLAARLKETLAERDKRISDSTMSGRYRCWVVVKRRPREVDVFGADRRAIAIRTVKRRVRELGTEGGVESQDARHPFEVTYSIVNGKLVTTEF